MSLVGVLLFRSGALFGARQALRGTEMRVRFVKSPGIHAGGDEFAIGEVYDLDDPSAWRWVRRKVAEIVEVETADAAPRKRRGRPRKTREISDGSDANEQTVG